MKKNDDVRLLSGDVMLAYRGRNERNVSVVVHNTRDAWLCVTSKRVFVSFGARHETTRDVVTTAFTND